ncbi:MAG: FprA family A-type flavoprotein, partial [Clostridium sp.]
ELVALVDGASGILVGSPTINQDAVEPAWNLLAHVSAIVNRGKAGAAFGSYGWSGEGVDMLTCRLKQLKFNTIPGFKFNFVPSEDELNHGADFAKEFITHLK